MEIKFLKAGTGDSILIHHQGNNIIIDGGNDSKYLLLEVDEIHNRNEKINLLVITHHDDDHIAGIIDLLNHIEENNYNKDSKFVEKIIFNSPRLILNKITKKDASNNLSYKQAYLVEEHLVNLNSQWDKCTESSDNILIDGLSVKILSPTDEDLNRYAIQKGAYLTSDWKCDWHSPMALLDPYINDDSQDTTISNASSLVLEVSYDDWRILLTGDVIPKRLETILNRLYNENNNKPIKFDYIKLPHHGSYRSLNKNILEKIDCSNFIISTSSKKYSLPNKRALLKILKFCPRPNNIPINFIFNYEESLNNLSINTDERSKYNFVLTPNNQKNGISIRKP